MLKSFFKKNKKNINPKNIDNILDLSRVPLIDEDNNFDDNKKYIFQEHYELALSLNSNGYGKLKIKDKNWINLIDKIREKLQNHINIKFSEKDNSEYNLRFQDAWKELKIIEVIKLACHKEILSVLKNLYGEMPIPFQTLNFKRGSQQPFHSDSVHFNSIPSGFMCGVWIAFEDIHPDAGPLEYFPKSHLFPYLSLNDINLSLDKIIEEEHPQKFFEPIWEELLRSKDLNREFLLASKGDVFIWHANLIHGGSIIKNKSLTRWSQVNHYFFEKTKYCCPFFHDKNNINNDLYFKKPQNLLEYEV